MTKLIAIDPGSTTGFVEAETSLVGITLLRVIEIPWERRFALRDLLWNEGSQPVPDKVIIESFRLYAHRAQSQVNNDFPSVRVIGIVEAALHEFGWLDKLVFQPASVRSRVVVASPYREQLRSPHTHDAFQHIRYYYVTHP